MEVGCNPLVDCRDNIPSFSSPAEIVLVNPFGKDNADLFFWQFLLEWGKEQWGEWHWTDLNVEDLWVELQLSHKKGAVRSMTRVRGEGGVLWVSFVVYWRVEGCFEIGRTRAVGVGCWEKV